MTSVVYKTYEEGDKRNLNPEVACMKDQEQCVICRRFFEQAETLVQIPQCKHIFHTKCLKNKDFNEERNHIIRGQGRVM